MSDDKDVLTGEHFTMGDLACAEGAISAGCRFFAGYPITPATEIAEIMAKRLPMVGGKYIQMEDEIASIIAAIGASYTGVKAMTATAGPGISLMLENIGLAAMVEAPLVIINVMRCGPSTGSPTNAGQGDIMQAKWGSHGDYEIIALAPSTVQEMYSLTIEAFNLSEEYRVPVFVLADGILGHMREKLVIPKKSEIKIVNRKKPTCKPEDYKPFKVDDSLVPPMATFGSGYRFYATGLTHNEMGYPDNNPKVYENLVKRLCDKIRKNADKIIKYEEFMLDDAEIVLVAYGSTARSAKRAVIDGRKKGIKVGLLRLITIWPFPGKKIKELSQRVRAFVVPEMNYGQIVREVERFTGNIPVISYPKLTGNIPLPNEILDVVMGV